MRNSFLVAGVRTPMGRYGGALATVRPDDLAALVVRTVIERSGIAPAAVDEVILGAANQAGEDNRNVARMAVLLAGLPADVPGYTVNRLCASGLTAVISAGQAIATGAADVIVAGGVESMTRAPWVMAKPSKAWQFPSELAETSLGWRFTNPQLVPLDGGEATISMGETAERVAALDGITREQADEFALESHRRAIAARGTVAGDIVPVETRYDVVDVDEVPREDASIEALSALRPAFRSDGIVTAGSSSPLSDGASAVLVVSEEALKQYGLTPAARIVGSANAGVRPSIMGLGPVAATEKLFKRIGWGIDDISTVELNEAFAAQALACIERLGLDRSIVNPEGGAIALGHPLGSSGSRIAWALARRLSAEGSAGDRGLASLCVGVGQGVSLALEAC
ncbi:thiolase family protein [Sinosporangium siamense]|uniref:Probable acetyl-CoA acetyltransferase n=1 Tax=Sinosporangium siamense TaxID=1367973 RepID=A0A919RN53_9ACTN|nr:thiolase family protein [Sinosporangium siamense]GII96847.1 putative beta-ketoadipyl-CoA thiolase [Sinosporangium siamense]